MSGLYIVPEGVRCLKSWERNEPEPVVPVLPPVLPPVLLLLPVAADCILASSAAFAWSLAQSSAVYLRLAL